MKDVDVYTLNQPTKNISFEPAIFTTDQRSKEQRSFMSLRNLMEEDKQLNLNQPLLSVRRNSSIVASSKDDMIRSRVDSFSFPRPPRYNSELKSGPVTNPGVVPFYWEQIPGKPKDEMKPQGDHTGERPVPKLPPGRISSFNGSKAMVVDDEKYESADEGEVFLDALDTLSRTESSVFLNCSVSGLDEPEEKPSTDPQTREFMINRFLPAAKAMASEKIPEIPHYATKKIQADVQEQPRQLKKVVKKPDRHYYQPRDYEEGSDDDDYSHEDVPVKACGLLPRFCFRGSFGLLNPVPGISVRNRAPNQKPERSSLSDNHNKPPQTNVSFDALGLPKKACKSFRELMAAEDSSVQEDSENRVAEKTMYVDTVHKLESPIPKSSSPEVKETFEILVTNRVEKHLVDHLEDDAGKLTSVVQETLNLDSLSATNELNSKAGRELGNAYRKEQDYHEETITSVKADNDRTVKSENPRGEFIVFPEPPPLPKSPSDSWLCRTLPSLSTKSFTFHPNLGTGNPRNQAPKWETIVKTTKRQDQHLRNSQELIPFRPVPEAL